MCLFLCGYFDTDVKRVLEASNPDNTAQKKIYRHTIMTKYISKYLLIFMVVIISQPYGGLLLRIAKQHLRAFGGRVEKVKTSAF